MAKSCIQLFFLALASVFWLGWKVLSCLVGQEQAFMSFSQLCCLWPGMTGAWFRAGFYRLVLENTSQNIVIAFLTSFSSSAAQIGEHVSIGTCCNIGWANIGAQTIIGSHVCITSGKNMHEFAALDTPIRLQGGEKKPVSIGRNCWIGNACLIMSDVGEGSVIGGGSVVVEEIPPFSIAVGNPAKVLKSRLKDAPTDPVSA